MSNVVADQMTSLAFHSQMHEGFVVGISQDGVPSLREYAAFCQSTEGIKQSVNLLQGQVKDAGLTFENFFVFGEDGLAENQGPSSRPKSFEKLKRRAPFGPESGIEDVGVHDGACGHGDLVPRDYSWSNRGQELFRHECSRVIP